MSKWIENINGRIYTELADKDQCGMMYNDICCCNKSDVLGDYPTEMDCRYCKYFKQEEMDDEQDDKAAGRAD